MSLSHRVYCINTINRLSGTSENFTYQLQIPASSDYNRVVVLNMSIPTSFYLIQDGINTFNMREDGIDRLITIPPGNYSADVFASTLIELFNTGAPAGWTYNIALPNSFTSPDTAKFTYTVTGNATQPSIVCTDQVNEQLGFHINSVNTFVDNSLVACTPRKVATEVRGICCAKEAGEDARAVGTTPAETTFRGVSSIAHTSLLPSSFFPCALYSSLLSLHRSLLSPHHEQGKQARRFLR